MISPHSNASAIADRNDFITSDFGRTTVVNNHGGDVANHPIFGAIEHPNFAVVVSSIDAITNVIHFNHDGGVWI